MNDDSSKPKESLTSSSVGSVPELEENGNTNRSYHPPQMFVIGKAVDLLQGGSGKHTDGYTGYYWNEEG